MAAMHSRATVARQTHFHHEDEEDDLEQSGHHTRDRSSNSATSLVGAQESWILFAPRPAQPQSAVSAIHALRSSHRQITPQHDEQDEEGEDTSDRTAATHNDSDTPSASAITIHLDAEPSSSWHVITPSSPTLGTGARDGSTTSVQLQRGHARPNDHHRTESCSSATSPGNVWTKFPTHSSSRFFDDDPFDELAPEDRDPTQPSIYATFPNLDATSAIIRSSGAASAEDTDMLSIPSSISVSDRTESSQMSSPKVARPALLPSESNLTRDALNRITSSHNTQDEAVLTSGSEDEGDLDPEEALLSRTPDAISAGIRPRKRTPLKSLNVSAQDSLSNKRSSQSATSSTKRRHRTAGLSDKGNKRQHRVPAPPKVKKFTLGETVRRIFEVDEELVEMMAQTGSVFGQPIPASSYSKKRTQAKVQSFVADELGETEGVRMLFSAHTYDDGVDSGNETETERTAYHRITAVDEADENEDPHTASLGLHRSSTFATLHHLLIESIYGSLSSTLLDGPTQEESSSQGQRKTRSMPPSRTGTPPIERSRSSSNIAQRHEQTHENNISYWKRLLWSLAVAY